ncbi:MAG TPA: SpoIID/LytB domain-containing protein [Methylomirabilota bacterium]|nr:SpoIID/LytB domain-containing protein [Methylomirabilota bacterium]
MRIDAIAPPASAEAIPRDTSARLIPCSGCASRRANGPVELHAADAHVVVGSAPPVSSVTLIGAWRIAPDLGRSVESNERMVATAAGGRLQLTLTMPEEEYVARVLAAEASNFKSDEALKAMAVAVRTYALRFRGRHHAQGFDFCDATHCQALRLGGLGTRFLKAAQSTEGQLLWYAGAPAATYYYLDCGGTTEAGGQDWPDHDTPYLVQHADPYCVLHGRTPWITSLTHEEIAQALVAQGIHAPKDWKTVTVYSHRQSGRVKLLKIAGETPLLISASKFRLAVNRAFGDRLRSDLYEISPQDGAFVFQGYGSGHGIGLCQRGADVMGMSGKSYGEILAFYYPGTTLGTGPPPTISTQQISEAIPQR